MKYQHLISLVVVALSLFTNGCATILTISAPSVEEITLGTKYIGKQISNNYNFVEGDIKGTLMRQPYCVETAEQNIMTRKRLHGVVPAMIEIPIYGLGLIDFVSAGIYAKASEEKKKGNYVETGRIVECGPFEPASETMLYVQCSETGQLRMVKTDNAGNIGTEALYKDYYQETRLNLFVKEDGGFAYITTLISN